MNKSKTSQRVRLLGLMGVITVLGICVQSALIDNYLLADFRRLEETQLRGNLRLINLWLDRFLQPLEKQATSLGEWQETALLLRGADPALIDARVQRLPGQETGFDVVLVLDDGGRAIYGRRWERMSGSVADLDPEQQRLLEEHAAFWRRSLPDARRSGWLETPHGLMAVAMQSIPGRGRAAARGSLVLARSFPPADLASLEELSGTVVFTTPVTEEAALEPGAALGEWRRGGDQSQALELCNGLSPDLNRRPLLLCAKLRDSIYLRGKASVDDLRLVSMIGFIVLIAVVSLFLDRALLRRLAALNKRLVAAKPDDTLKLELALLEDSQVRDELGQMSGGMGRLLRRVREAEQSLRQQEHSLRELTRNLEFQATHDDLTRLINRREFGRRLTEALDDCRRNGAPYALCYIDLDQFKLVNDIAGHNAGDLMLQRIAEVVMARVRATDCLARLGGDEFGLLLAHCTAEQALMVAEHVRQVISEVRLPWGDRSFSVDASVGVVMLDQVDGGIHEAMATADAACFLAKDQGRNRVQMAGRGDLDLQLQMGQMRWAQRLKDALEQNRFCLFRQGIHSLRGDGDWRACEILLRLQEPDGRLISAGEFLEAASRYQMAVGIDRWVVAAVLEHMQRERGPARMRYFVNLSGPSFADEGFRSFIVSRMAQHPELGPRLTIEVTETAVVSNLQRAKALMQLLRQYGVSFALDDFGTGVSSFGYLKELPVQYLKIAGPFVRKMCENPLDESVVRTFASFGQMRGIETVAEWVEDEATKLALQEMGVDYAQGYHYDRAAPLLTEITAVRPAGLAAIQ